MEGTLDGGVVTLDGGVVDPVGVVLIEGVGVVLIEGVGVGDGISTSACSLSLIFSTSKACML